MVEKLTLGIDLGGTKINLGLVDNTDHLLFGSKSIHVSKEPNVVVDKIIEDIHDCFNKSGKKAKAVGIGVAGQIDNMGVVRGSPNLGWQDFPLKKELEKKLDLPVFVINDVRAATWAEWSFGIGRGITDLVVLFVGTGVGGGVISSGKVLKGCTNSGGELGHITIVSSGRKCRC
ncbi:ROK family protein, partial [Candidatus Bathyarchaeota archaeon]|nr:ROK family protein [Candidatus Bathyarchaeota archaeon]